MERSLKLHRGCRAESQRPRTLAFCQVGLQGATGREDGGVPGCWGAAVPGPREGQGAALVQDLTLHLATSALCCLAWRTEWLPPQSGCLGDRNLCERLGSLTLPSTRKQKASFPRQNIYILVCQNIYSFGPGMAATICLQSSRLGNGGPRKVTGGMIELGPAWATGDPGVLIGLGL